VPWTRRPARAALDQLLEALPERFVIESLGPARFVAGPQGTYVVGTAEDTGPEVEDLGQLAAQVRAVLAQHLTWVPFVHPLLVSDDPHPGARVAVVPRSMLVDVLTEGREAIEDDAVDRIHELVHRGLIGAIANREGGQPAATMSGCDTWPRPMASPSPSTTSAATGSPHSWPTPPGSTGWSGPPSPAD
jgi:hypothetical protein